MKTHSHVSIGLLLLFLHGGLSAGGDTSKDSKRTGAAGAEITFFVASVHGPAIEGAEVSVVSGSGVHLLGKVDGRGVLKVARATVEAKKPALFLFCHPQYFCGAIRTDRQAVREVSDLFITLAPFGVR